MATKQQMLDAMSAHLVGKPFDVRDVQVLVKGEMSSRMISAYLAKAHADGWVKVVGKRSCNRNGVCNVYQMLPEFGQRAAQAKHDASLFADAAVFARVSQAIDALAMVGQAKSNQPRAV